MKEITKTYTLLDRQDIEQALSQKAGKKISISDVVVTYDCLIDSSAEKPVQTEMRFLVDALEGLREYYEYDVFFDEEKNGLYFNGKELNWYDACLSPKDIFDFDISLFKGFIW